VELAVAVITVVEKTLGGAVVGVMMLVDVTVMLPVALSKEDRWTQVSTVEPVKGTGGVVTTEAMEESAVLMMLLTDAPWQEGSEIVGGWGCSLTGTVTAVVVKMVVTLIWSLVLEIAGGAP
jgi:hypothetical protein